MEDLPLEKSDSNDVLRVPSLLREVATELSPDRVGAAVTFVTVTSQGRWSVDACGGLSLIHI